MEPIVFIVWLVTIAVDTVGQLAFKAIALRGAEYEGMERWVALAKMPMMWLGIGCYVVEFIVWLAFLSLVPLSDGVMLGCINIVVIMIAGRLFFKEKITKYRLMGVLLITAGVAVIGMSI
ncbi:EamA family transporter [Acinetobacter sp. ESL0695]|uniref:EamA family transporter n=1 Tax=Acinetobacter pollinis TaxID=2605270 RepID=A0ABU6DVT7_9GAMM|nr:MULTISPECIES: EamA family transporter [Acinetobacter]MEB5476958.1 EamA family transporter [Acinetobacter pollinis]WEV49211.1 EamA family transporter [Acinetobacter sp. ESL0695]